MQTITQSTKSALNSPKSIEEAYSLNDNLINLDTSEDKEGNRFYIYFRS